MNYSKAELRELIARHDEHEDFYRRMLAVLDGDAWEWPWDD